MYRNDCTLWLPLLGCGILIGTSYVVVWNLMLWFVSQKMLGIFGVVTPLKPLCWDTQLMDLRHSKSAPVISCVESSLDPLCSLYAPWCEACPNIFQNNIEHFITIISARKTPMAAVGSGSSCKAALDPRGKRRSRRCHLVFFGQVKRFCSKHESITHIKYVFDVKVIQ